jgi:hypothetical protein
MASQISASFPLVKTFVTSFTNADNAWFVLGLECLFTNAPSSEPDLLALCIEIDGEEDPLIQVDVSWGDPSGHIEAELFESARRISLETLEAVERGLPSLFVILQRSVERKA